MGLVDYSDSDNSDSDAATAPKPAATSAKPTFKKVVDRSNPRKILVNLPTLAGQDEPGENPATDGPPAKRPRIGGGGGAFSGFNALLPAPKRTGQAAGGGINGSAAGKSGLGRGISLKTGATPGFSREEVSESFDGEDSHRNDINSKDNHDTPPKHQEAAQELATALPPNGKPTAEPKKTGSAMMFKPLSVARKPPKKSSNTTTSISTEPPPALPKKKVSLFPLSAADHQGNPPPPLPPPTTLSPSDYSPLIYQPASSQDPLEDPQNGLNVTQSQNPPTLDEIATSLNLSNSAKRQLFGRRGTSASPTIINFNTDVEYAANEQLRAEGETVQHNPVRAIAPGKHSLKQLVNAASNQKEALEEHFAMGKRNKREAGSRYGWEWPTMDVPIPRNVARGTSNAGTTPTARRSAAPGCIPKIPEQDADVMRAQRAERRNRTMDSQYRAL
ncbi:hypothetical protein GP486_006930, partial [Trichoglossum hirsutum]